MAGDDDHPARCDIKVGHGGAPGIACWHLEGNLWASEKVVLFARHQDQKTVIRLSDELVNEIISIVVMAPMAMVNLRAAFAPFLIATDASLSGRCSDSPAHLRVYSRAV